MLNIVQDAAEFARRLPITVRGPGSQPLEDDFGRRAEQDDQIKPREKFPARFALGISRLVASRPTAAIATLDSPKSIEPPVKATIETRKMSTKATNALPASTVRFSRVVGSESSALTTDTATTSNPKMAADAPALAMKKFSY
jgi:hypothetical protein